MRYSEQWAQWFPDAFQKRFGNVKQCLGLPTSKQIKTGAFLDVYETHRFKFTQLAEVIYQIENANEDLFVLFFHDLWFPGLEAIEYIRQMTAKRIIVAGYLHAGAYDETDLLGQTELSSIVRGSESSWLRIADVVFVGSTYHAEKIRKKFFGDAPNKVRVVGNPVDVDNALTKPWDQRKDLVIFPHRLTDDKQPWVAKEIVRRFKHYCPTFDLVFTHQMQLTKKKYQELLGESKFVLSTATHENFGIAMVEGAMMGCYPVMPDALAYPEVVEDGIFYDEIDSCVGVMIHRAEHATTTFGGQHVETYRPLNVLRKVCDHIEAAIVKGRP